MGNSSSRQRSVVKYQESETRIVSTHGNASANITYNGEEASATASSARGSGIAYSSDRTYYVEAAGEGRAMATGGGAAAMAGSDNYGTAYRSQANQHRIENRHSSSNYLENKSASDDTSYNTTSYAAVRGNGTAGYLRDAGQAGVSVHGKGGRASVKKDGDDVCVYFDGKGTAGADEDRIWAQIGDNLATVQFSDEASCSCTKGECTCVSSDTMTC